MILRRPVATGVAVAAPVAAAQAEAPPTPDDEVIVAARAPTALKPGEEYERRAPRAVEEEAPTVNPGDLICTQCGTGNSPTNKFCKRCGHSLAEAPTMQKKSWIKRFFGFFAFRKKKKGYSAGERKKKQRQADGGGKGKIFWRLQGMSFKTVGIIMIGIAALGAYAAFGGTLQDRAKSNYNALHAKFLPTYTAIRPGEMRATASSHKRAATSAGKAIDGKCNTPWISRASKTAGVGETLTVRLQNASRIGLILLKNGDLSAAKDCSDLSNVKSYDNQSRVKEARIRFFNSRGAPVGKARLCNFGDKSGTAQKCKLDQKGVRIIKMRVLSIYPSDKKGKSVAVSEFEPQTKS